LFRLILIVQSLGLCLFGV